jgi:glycosyltransferase involved in cell wall biosynthesis
MTTGVTVVLVDRPAAPVPDDLPGALLTGALPVQVLVVDAGGGLAQRQRDGAFDVVTLPPVAPGRTSSTPATTATATATATATDGPSGVTARNAGLARVATPLVAFLGSRARPASDWLAPAVRLFDEHPDLSAVSAHVPGQPPRGVTAIATPGPAQEPEGPDGEILWPAPEAFVARTDHLRAIGGYDDRLASPGAELDLGWRLWLAGGSVRRSDRSEVPVLVDPWATEAAEFGRPALDGLVTLFKCFDDSRLARALPAALMALGGAAVPAAREDGRHDVGPVLRAFAHLLPELRAAREEVQAGRRRGDDELFRRSSRPLDVLTGPDVDLGPVIEGLGLDELFGRSRRVLVVTADVLTERLAGPAIRAWHIAQRLADDGHQVRLVTTSPLCRSTSDSFTVTTAGAEGLDGHEAWAEVVVIQGFVLLHSPTLRATDKIMVVDIYDPLHLENLEMSRRDDLPTRQSRVSVAVDALNEQLRRGDFFLCASDKQRDLWIGHLSALGRVNAENYAADAMLRSLIDVVPFGLPDTPAVQTRPALKGVVPGIGPDDEVILWGGGIYNWFDPLTLIRAMDKLHVRRPGARLFFMGLRHPNPEVPEMAMATRARALADELGLTDRVVFFNEGWVSYDDRQNFLLEADIGVSTHFEHAETAFSFRTRILDYLWAGLPVVSTAGDSFADLVEREGLGTVVPPEDVDELEAALYGLLSDGERRERATTAVARVRDRFTWSTVMAPLVAFCRQPHRAADLPFPIAPAPPEAGPPAAPRGLRRDLRTAATLWRQGGPSGVLTGVARRARGHR